MDITSGMYLLKGKTLVFDDDNKQYNIYEIRYSINGVIHIYLQGKYRKGRFSIEMNPKQFKALATNGEAMGCYIKELIDK